MTETNGTLLVNEQRELTKAQKKRLEKYQSLGTASKARNEKQKFDARSASLNQKSFSRRRKLDQLSMYEQFVELLSIHSSKTLNPSNFVDYMVSIISVYIGQNQTVLVHSVSSNKHPKNGLPLSIKMIDMLIPFASPRDRISFLMPQQFRPKAEEKKAPPAEPASKAIDNDKDSKHMVNINASYAFAALPDQRLFADGKSTPYVFDDAFKWTIIYGTGCCPPKLRNTAAGFQKIVAAAMLSNGVDTTYCIYGTRQGLYYNDQRSNRPIRLIKTRVDGIFRQNDDLFVLCRGPKLLSVSLTTKNNQVTVHEVFSTATSYKVYSVFHAFIGAYYDRPSGRLILGTSNAMVYVFHNGGTVDEAFNDRFMAFRRKQIQSEDKQLEKGNCLYYDVDRQCIIYIGTKFMIKLALPLSEEDRPQPQLQDSQFATIYDLKWFLKGIDYDCNYFLYIYHQKTLVVMKKLQSSSPNPFLLKTYTGKSLLFD